MKQMLEEADFKIAKAGYVANEPQLSSSLHARCYTEKKYLAVEQHAIFQNTWQWACHEEKLREAGSYYVKDIAGHSILLLRNGGGDLRAFYNVCQHRAHELLQGEGHAADVLVNFCHRGDGLFLSGMDALARIPQRGNAPRLNGELGRYILDAIYPNWSATMERRRLRLPFGRKEVAL